MADFVKVAQVSDVAPGEMIEVQVGGEPVCLANVDGDFFAIHNTCTHRGGPLADGELEGAIVTCPWHAGQFNVRSGEVVASPPAQPIKTYNVRVDGQDILIEAP